MTSPDPLTPATNPVKMAPVETLVVFVDGIGPPLQQIEEDYRTVADRGEGGGMAEDVLALIAEVVRLRAVLTEIAGHPVVSESTPNDNCDWHCTATMVARAKDALNA